MTTIAGYLVLYLIICLNPIGLIMGAIYAIKQDINDKDTLFVFCYWPFLLIWDIILIPFRKHKTYYFDPYNDSGLL
jgi:hypothetical protein